LTARTITAGTGISVTNGTGASGDPTIANTGVTTVDSQTGNVTLANLAVFANSLLTNGYQKLPGGLIIQWGTYNSTTDTAENFNWPIAFPTSCLCAVGTFSVTSFPLPITTFTASNFTVDRSGSVTGTQACRVIGLGY
jgi:hypothetical protein